MKYESTILKRLIDTYGVVGNPRYISEIIKEFIVRGKECFPNLFTYQADWLAHIDEFGLNPTYTVSYTGHSIYAPNTLERPVKSAILKGQTLVNISPLNGEITLTPASVQHIDSPFIKSNTTFTISFNCSSVPTTGFIEFRQIFENTALKMENKPVVQGYNQFKVTTVSSEINRFRFKNDSTSETDFTFNNLMIIEGDYTNVDIPFFEGMKSVKMPVLTTIGKNLFNKEGLVLQNKKRVRADNGEFVYSTSSSGFDNYFDCQFLQGKTINVSSIATGTGGGIAFYTIDKTYIKGGNLANSQLVPENAFYYRFSINVLDTSIDEAKIQIEVNSVATLYEPYKSNILMVNEEVELRGVGDVRDELNLLTSEMTQNIYEFILDGSQNIDSDGDLLYYNLPLGVHNNISKSDKLPSINVAQILDGLTGIAPQNRGNASRVYININGITTKEEMKNFFLNNPTTIQCVLVEKFIKTVDLTILDQNGQNVKQLMSFNGGTHFITKSLEGSPLPEVSVSVETDLEETLMMCSLEGNTL